MSLLADIPEIAEFTVEHREQQPSTSAYMRSSGVNNRILVSFSRIQLDRLHGVVPGRWREGLDGRPRVREDIPKATCGT